jgi:hypothetical protein
VFLQLPPAVPSGGDYDDGGPEGIRGLNLFSIEAKAIPATVRLTWFSHSFIIIFPTPTHSSQSILEFASFNLSIFFFGRQPPFLKIINNKKKMSAIPPAWSPNTGTIVSQGPSGHRYPVNIIFN